MQRLTTVLLAIFAVVVVAAAVYVTAKNDDAASSGRTSFAVPSSPAATPTPSTSSGTGATSGAARPLPAVAFLGDEWTSGLGASGKAKRFTTLVTDRLGVVERNFGASGVGYAGDEGYRAKVDDIAAAKPDVVVVAGGRDDVVDHDTNSAVDGAAALFVALHHRVPDAVLVAVAPMWGDSDPPAELAHLGRSVEKAVTKAGGTYLDVDDPINGHPGYMADESDPDDDGYRAIADALAPKLDKLLPN